MRMAQGQIRPVLVGRAHGPRPLPERSRSQKGRSRHAGHDEDAKDHHRRPRQGICRLAQHLTGKHFIAEGHLRWRPPLSVPCHRSSCTGPDKSCGPAAPAARPRGTRCHCTPDIHAQSASRSAFSFDLSGCAASVGGLFANARLSSLFPNPEWRAHDPRPCKPEEVTERHVNDLMSGKLVIAVATVRGKIRDIWITKNPSVGLRYCPPHETRYFRLMSCFAARAAESI